MHDSLTFEPRLIDALGRLAELVPVMDEVQIVDAATAARPSWASRLFGGGRSATFGRSSRRLVYLSVALGTVGVVVIAAALAVSFYANQKSVEPAKPAPLPTTQSPTASPAPQQSLDLGIFEPVAGRIVYESSGIWGYDPVAADPATNVQLTSEAGTPLGWSSAGTELLIMRPIDRTDTEFLFDRTIHLGEVLFVLHADGSETQVTPDPMHISGATISPDGSRVVFAAQESEVPGEPVSCCSHRPALYSVDVDGGPADVLWETRKGSVEEPTFAPDGTRIAFVDGGGDNSHSVWVMKADGTDAHQIVYRDCACHVDGLVWSPGGDRIALGITGALYTFATDGSDFNQVITHADGPDGAPLLQQFAYSILWEDGFAKSGPWHPGTPSGSGEPTPAPSPIGDQATALLSGFLEARVAGVGAEQYLSDEVVDIPLLYATTSGAAYERGDFERVTGIEWPYGWTGFKVRLFAGETVVEQLFFTPEEGPLWLEYVRDGFRTNIAPTTEDGESIAETQSIFNGELTFQVGYPWFFGMNLPRAERLIPEGARPTTDGGERHGWDELVLLADPPLAATGCRDLDAADAEALAESVRSDPDNEATAPVTVSVGGADVWMVDVATTAVFCAGTANFDLATQDRMRLYLFDVPDGLSMRILAVEIITSDAQFKHAVQAAEPVLNSVEFHVL